MKSKIKTLLGNGSVVHHEKTPKNQIGQSGIHTLALDINDLFENTILNDNQLQLKDNLKKILYKRK
jgi:hypothetical protein